MVEFGEKLKRAREEKGMTQQTLSDHLYVTRQAVSRWECGARYPDLLTAKKLSEVLEVSLDEFGRSYSQMVVCFLSEYHWCLPPTFHPNRHGSCCHW